MKKNNNKNKNKKKEKQHTEKKKDRNTRQKQNKINYFLCGPFAAGIHITITIEVEKHMQ